MARTLNGFPSDTPTMPNMLISVLTPTMGRATSFLLDCISSVEAQDIPSGWEVEHVLALNGPFKEEEILKQIAKQHRGVKLVYSDKDGVSAARNVAFLASQGSILLDLDDDDLLPSSSIKDRVNHLLISDRAWSIGNLLKVEEDLKYKIGGDLRVKEMPNNDLGMMRGFLSGTHHAWTGTRTYHRSALVAAGPWDESFLVAEDLEHWLRLTAKTGAPAHCDRWLCFFREKEYSLGINAVKSGLMKTNQDRAIARWSQWEPGAPYPEDLPTWEVA